MEIINRKTIKWIFIVVVLTTFLLKLDEVFAF